MNNLTDKELLGICTKDYFGNVDKKNIKEVLATMHHDAIIEIKTDNLIHSGRDSEIKKMLNGYFEAFPKLWHGDFSPVVDEQRQIVVLQFNWSIVNTKKEEDNGSNVNIFKFKDGKIAHITIYMSSKENPLK